MVRKRSRKIILKREILIAKKDFKVKKKRNFVVPLLLICLFFLVLLFNTYFNHISNVAINPEGTTLGNKYYYSGTDPYYNMRLCQITYETGTYPYPSLDSGDPLLNYPIGITGGARPPLFNMIAVTTAHFLSNFMPDIDALGLAMLFLPAIYGALLVFPVYGIGKELFNRKVGIVSALLVPLIPLHLISGHGSAYSLFDHDSFLLLLSVCIFFFLIKSYKSEKHSKSLLFASLAGILIGCFELTWAAAQALYLLIVVFLVVQLFIDILKGITLQKIIVPVSTSLAFVVGYLIALPFNIINQSVTGFLFFVMLITLGISGVYLIIYKIKLPWIITVPVMFTFGIVFLIFLKLVNDGAIKTWSILLNISNVIFGAGVYGSQVDMTIGEAHTYGISQSVMSFGPVLYWVAFSGFILFLYHTYKNHLRPYDMLFITIFFVQFWFTTVAGRFLNDMVPVICIFSAYMLVKIVDKLDYKQMIQRIKSIGGFRGIRKGIKISQLVGILFIVFLVFLPNSFLALDAATPAPLKEEMFGAGYIGSYGLGFGQERYWMDAFYWLSQQDTSISSDADKPAVLTWWDYGFFEVAEGKHPTVADPYQDGIPPASNFLTAQSEKEATAVLIIRIVEGTKKPMMWAVGTIPQEVKDVFSKYTNQSENISNIIENPYSAPSYNQLISPEWGNTILRTDEFNAMYHDTTSILVNLSDSDLTKLYHDMMAVTGYQIRYFGVEQRDMYAIFGVFPFLADKSTHNYVTTEDDWYKTVWVDTNTGAEYTYDEVTGFTSQEREEMSLTPTTHRKDTFYNSMAFRIYFGLKDSAEDVLPESRIPCYLMRHWKAEYISPYLTLCKYYEGAPITGNVILGDNIAYDGSVIYVIDENGIPHDYHMTTNGEFNVVAPAGNITLLLFIENQQLDEYNIGDVTEEQAIWKQSSNFTVTFKVNMSSVYVQVVNQTGLLNITSLSYGFSPISQNVSIGNYSFENLIPSTYRFEILDESGNVTYTVDKFLAPDENNITIGE